MAIRYRVPDIEYYMDFGSFRKIVLDSAQLYNAVTVTAGRGRRGTCAPGGILQRAAFGGAKIWNYEIWLLLAYWGMHYRQ